MFENQAKHFIFALIAALLGVARAQAQLNYSATNSALVLYT